MWDQRCWHQATARTKSGLRIFSIFGFQTIQVFRDYGARAMPRSLAQAWLDAKGTGDESFFGGVWDVESVMKGLAESEKRSG